MKTLKLEKKTESKKSMWALAAANIRRELKHNFPGITFRVTSDSYTGGSSVRVKWTDGVTTAEVDAIINKYKYGTFDGMQDLYEYDKNFSDMYGEAKYLFSERSYSKEAYKEAIEASKTESEPLELLENDHGFWMDGDYNADRRARIYLSEKSFYSKPEPKKDAAPEAAAGEVKDFSELIESGDISEVEHTRTKEILKVLKIKTKLDKETFKEFLKYIQSNSIGYYSRFVGGVILTD